MDPSNPFISPADIYLLDQWQDDSSLPPMEHLANIFADFVKLGKEGRQPYLDQLKHRQVKFASDLTSTERDTLDRLRQPVLERLLEPSDGTWLRTCYSPGGEAASSVLKQSHLDRLYDALVLDDASLYDFGPHGWQQIFSRMPQLLGSNVSNARDYHDEIQAALLQARQNEVDDRATAEESGYDPDEDASPWEYLYEGYHWVVSTGYLFIIDDVTLSFDDSEDSERGTVLVVWFDDCGRVVRSCRETIQEAISHAGLLLEGFVREHRVWVEAHVGEEYDRGAPLGPSYDGEGDTHTHE